MLKPLRPSSTVTVVWPWDTAFDQDHKVEVDKPGHPGQKEVVSAGVAYGRVAAKDPSAWKGLLVQSGTDAPTEFIIGPISTDEINRLHDDTVEIASSLAGEVMRIRERRRHWGAFLASLVDIKNGPTNDKGEVPGAGRRVDPGWLRTAFNDPTMRAAAWWVGSIAWEWNNFTGDDVKNS